MKPTFVAHAMLRRIALTIVLSILLTACASEPQVGESEIRYGRIARIDPVSLEGDQQLGLGAIIGGVAGGVLGHQFGGGTGQTVATVAGALGGAVAGSVVQNKYVERRPGQHIIVTLDNGVAVGITQPADPALQVGDSVRIEGSGPNARVIRR